MELNKKDLYLYRLDRSFSNYRVGSIKRINDKTITMDDGRKFLKEEFDYKTHKLTDKEKQMYEGIVFKEIIQDRHSIYNFLYQLKELNKAIQTSPLATVDTTKLQEKVDALTAKLSETFDKCFKINEEEYEVTMHHELKKIEK